MTPSKRSLSGLLAALLCTSCLVSEEPFILEGEATLPVKNGTVLQKYAGKKNDANLTYVEDVVLNIERGKYYTIENQGTFLVRPIAGTPYLLAMTESFGSYGYGLIGYNSEDAIYFVLEPMSSNLDKYLASRPDETPQNLERQGVNTIFQNRADLERLVVAMAEQGYYEHIAAYRPVQVTAKEQEKRQQPGQPEQSISPGAAIVGGLVGLGVLAWLFSGSGDSGSAAGSSSGESSRPCGQDWQIEPGKLPCGNEYRPFGQWEARFWCYTDYNMQISGQLGVTYCTNGHSTWERSALFDHCNGKEGWCDWGD